MSKAAVEYSCGSGNTGAMADVTENAWAPTSRRCW